MGKEAWGKLYLKRVKAIAASYFEKAVAWFEAALQYAPRHKLFIEKQLEARELLERLTE